MAAGSMDLEPMREFVVGGNTDVPWRRQQLEALRQALIDEKDACLEALYQDLGVDKPQAQLYQVTSIFAEIDVCLDNLHKWTAPESVPTPLALQPASSWVQAQPKGVVLIFGTFNYPFNISLGPLICALAAGNAIVLKPSELAPESANVIQRICQRLDQRAVQCVLGGPDVAEALTHLPFDHIFYTGGPRVAKMILAVAAKSLTPVTCELGGKSPVIVAKGTNLNEACHRILQGKFTNTGQTCIAPDYVLVERSISEEFASTLVQTARRQLSEQPHTADTVGRIVNSQTAKRLLGYLAEDHGGKVLLGGEMPPEPIREGHRYVPPTIILDPRKDSMVLQEEIFGPILSIVPVDSYEDAIQYVNSKPKPLVLYVFAPSSVVKQISDRTSSGNLLIGDTMTHKANASLPFGGIGNSGMGKSHGIYGFREFSNLRGVMNRPLSLPSPLRLPIDPKLSDAALMYATKRPGKAVREQGWKLFLILAAMFAGRRLVKSRL